MQASLPERLSVVETKVSAHEDTLNDMAAKVDTIFEHVVAERAKLKQRTQFFAAIAGFVAFCGTLWEIFRRP